MHLPNDLEPIRTLARAGKLAGLTIIDDTDFANEMIRYVPFVVLRKYGVEHRGYVEYNAAPGVIYQFDNEVNNPDDLAYYMDVMRQADAHNRRKVVIFNDSVGATQESTWRRRQPALEYAKANGHFAAIHQYGDVAFGDNFYKPMIDLDHPGAFKWFTGRIYWLMGLMPPQAQPNFIGTEAGAGGYQRNAGNVETWLADVRRMDAFAQAYPWDKSFNLWDYTRLGLSFDRDLINDWVHVL